MWFGVELQLSFAVIISGLTWRAIRPNEAVKEFVGRPFQAVVATKPLQTRCPEKGVLHLFTALSGHQHVSPRQRPGFAIPGDG
jgi:hypothetical protein